MRLLRNETTMSAPLSPHLRAALAAYAPHGIDAIDARDIVAAASREPDFARALEAIRAEFGTCFTQSGRQWFEHAVRQHGMALLKVRCPSALEERARGQSRATRADLALWRCELEREHDRKRHAFLLGALFGFPSVSACAVALILEDARRLRSIGGTGPDATEQMLESMRVDQLADASRDDTHRLMQMLSAREPEREALGYLSELCTTASGALRRSLRLDGSALIAELAKKAHPGNGTAEAELRTTLVARLAPISEGN